MEEKEIKKERIKLFIVGVACLLLTVVVAGYTYSYFVVRDADTTTITGTVASGELSLTINQVAPSGDYQSLGLVPQLDSAITSAVVGRNNLNCVDDYGKAVCQVYKVTVTNESNMSAHIDGLIRLNIGDNPNLKWALIDSYTNGMTTKPNLKTEVNPHQISTMVANEEIGASGSSNATKTYYLVIWISEIGGEQEDTGDFGGVVTFKTSEISEAATTLYALGIAPNTETPDFSKTSCSSGCGENTVGVYSYEDDLGTSYYFRGDVENNYVYFANKYWRIIRINGDGTIRMIYDGTSAHANGESDPDRRITTSAFNSSPYNDNTYVGYMYGTSGIVGTGVIPYGITHSNSTDSTIKTYLEDTWYPTLSDADKGKIADAIYCNDRTLDTSDASYTGIGTTKTNYAAYQRLLLITPPEPKLTCENKNDRFTYNASIGGVEGNDKLEAPVGLITADEVKLAGDNSKNYLYIGSAYWTMTPALFNGTTAVGQVVEFALRTYPIYFDSTGVRAVTSLSSTAIKSGTGTRTNPFKVTE